MRDYILMNRKFFFRSFLLLGTLLTVASCNQPKSNYTVSGKINAEIKSDTLYLAVNKNSEWLKIDSCEVIDSTFCFRGHIDSTVICYLIDQEEQSYKSLYLEAGQIEVDLENGVVKGSANNDLAAAFHAKTKDYKERMHELYHEYMDAGSDAVRDSIEVLYDEVDAILDSLSEENVLSNLDNFYGIHQLACVYHNMPLPELCAILDSIPAQFENNYYVKTMKADVKNILATQEGMPYIDFTLQTPEGESCPLSSFVGNFKLVMIDFWASWCSPCRNEMPNLVKLYAEYASKGFEIVGVSLDRDLESWKQGIAELGITWPQLSDLAYWDCAAAALYGVAAIPTTVLIDQNGTIIARDLRDEALAEKLAELLAE